MNQPKVKYSLSNWDLVTVNPNYKTWNWKDLFCFWGVNIQSVVGIAGCSKLMNNLLSEIKSKTIYRDAISENAIILCIFTPQKQNKSFQFQVL